MAILFTPNAIKRIVPKKETFVFDVITGILGGYVVFKKIDTSDIYVITRFNAKNKSLPLNLTASLIYQLLADAPSDDYLFGDVLICKEWELI